MKTNTTTSFSKTIAIAVIAMVSSVSAFSQDLRLSGGLELGVPMGNFSDIGKIGGGISARLEGSIKTVDKLNWTAGLGFLSFGGKTFNDGFGDTYKVSFSAVPIQGGVKYYLTERNAGLYVSGELGLTVLSSHVSGNQGVFGNYGSTTKFSFAPGVGYLYGNFDFTGRFQLASDFTYFNIRAAYSFPIGK